MIEVLLNFLVGIILLFIFPIILLRRRNIELHNMYLMVFVVFAGLQRCIYALDQLNLFWDYKNPITNNLLASYFIPTIFYLYLKNLLQEKKSKQKDYLYLAAALFIITIKFILNLRPYHGQIIYFVYSSVYIFLFGRLFLAYFFKKKPVKKVAIRKAMKYWILLCFLGMLLFYLLQIYNFSLGTPNDKKQMMENFYRFSLALWCIAILYAIANPIILYGETYLLKSINKPKEEVFTIWRSSRKKIVGLNDFKTEKIIAPNLENILHSLNSYEKNIYENFTQIPTIKELSTTLGIPQIHLKYVFKYYNNYSFKEYQNILKIKYAISLIQSKYLDKHTVDSLGRACMFDSRITFHNNFKKYTNKTVTEYLKKV
jgi:AraC-like DNA-binding protein